MAARTLTQYLLGVGSQRLDFGYAHILSAVSVAVKIIASMVSRGPLIVDPDRHDAPSERDVNRLLRRRALDALLAQTESVEQLAAISIAGSSEIVPVAPEGDYLLLFEPLHGMANLADNLPVGSTFSVLRRQGSGPCSAADFLQAGSGQLCAGLALFGPRTILVLTTGHGVDGFTFDRDVGNFVLTHPMMTIPSEPDTLTVHAADAPHWPAPVKRYVEECVLGADGPRGRDFRMRWNASALVGAYRVLRSGGLFLAPPLDRPGGWLAPLPHTAAPLAFLAEQAGGRASTGERRILDQLPTRLGDRVPLFFGSADEVTRLEAYYDEHQRGDDREFTHPLFHSRSLFVD